MEESDWFNLAAYLEIQGLLSYPSPMRQSELYQWKIEVLPSYNYEYVQESAKKKYFSTFFTKQMFDKTTSGPLIVMFSIFLKDGILL